MKQPKYLFGGIVGAIYFYFYFFRYLFGFGGARNPVGSATGADVLPLYESIAALVLLFIVLLGWVLPRERAALAFSEAEVAFLFPAPVTRKGLIHYKLLRSQFAIAFTSIFLLLVSHRFGGKAWIHAVGWWCVLSTLNLHLLAASFARTKLLDRGITHWQRRLTILVVLVVAGASVLLWLRRSLPAFDVSEAHTAESLKAYARLALQSGPLPWFLAPFRIVVRPYFATDLFSLLYALAPAVAILLIHYAWVVRSDVAFEEASVEASRKLADKIASIRSGQWQAHGKPKKAKRAPFVLRPMGAAPVALLWKNLISAGQAFSLRFWIMMGVFCLTMALVFTQSSGSSGFTGALGFICPMLILWSLMLGPQLLRQDFRQDLALVDVLKSWPLPGWQVAFGELLAPACILTLAHWLLIAISLVLLLPSKLPGVSSSLVAVAGLGATILLPLLNLIILQIPNAAALLFPAWFQPGKDTPHGFEATGQRIIFMLAQLFVFVGSIIPPAIAFLVIFLLLKDIGGLPLVVLLGSFAASILLAAEAAAGIYFLGQAFARFDAGELTP